MVTDKTVTGILFVQIDSKQWPEEHDTMIEDCNTSNSFLK